MKIIASITAAVALFAGPAQAQSASEQEAAPSESTELDEALGELLKGVSVNRIADARGTACLANLGNPEAQQKAVGELQMPLSGRVRNVGKKARSCSVDAASREDAEAIDVALKRVISEHGGEVLAQEKSSLPSETKAKDSEVMQYPISLNGERYLVASNKAYDPEGTTTLPPIVFINLFEKTG